MKDMMKVHEPPTRAIVSAKRSPKPSPRATASLTSRETGLRSMALWRTRLSSSLRASGRRLQPAAGKIGNGFRHRRLHARLGLAAMPPYRSMPAGRKSRSMRAGTMPSFKKIRERAAKRKGGDAALQSLLGPRPDNAALAKVPDDRILSTMAERIFSAGFVWSVIEQKWPGFEEAFLGFEPKTLLFQPEDFWHDLTSDKRIVRNPPEDHVGARERGLRRPHLEGAWQLRQVPRRMAGRRPGRADGLSRQAWQPARRRDRPVFPALAGLGHLHRLARHGSRACATPGSTSPRRRPRRKTCRRCRTRSTPGSRRPACRASTSRASSPCRSARTIRRRRSAGLYGRIVAQAITAGIGIAAR